MAELLFYLLAAGTIGFGAGVVSAKMPLYSVLCLLGSFFCLAGIYLLAGFQFLAATQLLVYAGAIMVLFLFVIMLLNLGDESEYEESPRAVLGKKRLGFAAGAAGVLVLIGIFSAGWTETLASDPTIEAQGIDALEPLATTLFSRYILPFEASSLLLLTTMIAVILLAKRQRPGQATAEEEGIGWPWKKGTEQ